WSSRDTSTHKAVACRLPARTSGPPYLRLGWRRPRLPLTAQRPIDDLAKALDGLCAAHALAVDEEGGRAVDVELVACRLELVLDGVAMDGLVEPFAEPLHVEPQLLRVLLDRGQIERILVRKQPVVHLPELALIARHARGLGRLPRLRMHRHRVVLPDHSQLGA